MGFQQNLTVGEIFDQVWRLDQVAREHFGRPVTNVVFMGMGEPLHNLENVLKAYWINLPWQVLVLKTIVSSLLPRCS